MKPFPLSKPGGWSNASNGTTLQSTAVWLDLAESELDVLSTQCLDRCIPDKQILTDEIAAWEKDRNANHTKANWQFSTKDTELSNFSVCPSAA